MGNFFAVYFKRFAISYCQGLVLVRATRWLLPLTIFAGISFITYNTINNSFAFVLTYLCSGVLLTLGSIMLSLYIQERGYYYHALAVGDAGECYSYVKRYGKNYDVMLDAVLLHPNDALKHFAHTMNYWYMEFPCDRDKIFCFLKEHNILGDGYIAWNNNEASFIGAGLYTIGDGKVPDASFPDDFYKHCSILINNFYKNAVKDGPLSDDVVNSFVKRVNDSYYGECKRRNHSSNFKNYEDFVLLDDVVRIKSSSNDYFTINDFYSLLPADAQLGVLI